MAKSKLEDLKTIITIAAVVLSIAAALTAYASGKTEALSVKHDKDIAAVKLSVQQLEFARMTQQIHILENNYTPAQKAAYLKGQRAILENKMKTNPE